MHPAFPLSAPLPTQDRPKTDRPEGFVFTGPLGTEQRFCYTLGDLGLDIKGASPHTVVTFGHDPFALITLKETSP